MSRKKKEPEAQTVDTDPKVLRLTETEILKLKLYESEARRYSLEVSVKLLAKMEHLRVIDPDGKLAAFDRDAREFISCGTQAKDAHRATTTSIGERLGINMAEYNYDDITGTLSPAPTE